ncbi:hypothetical protein [Rhodococcus sp. KBS0724]|jgi:hypothetical protein|uniref:hypothetical protein n=1 Tax=Rhodococcus sp. KBS0724 TaxID=1179674 RepID=UPI00163DCAEA|nr:hypothetical protein [Rhodococcus sp. KBS0724]
MGGVDVFTGGFEGSQPAIAIGAGVEVKRGIEAGDAQAGVMFLDAPLGDGVGGVECAHLPGQCLRRIGAEFSEVVRECAAVKGIPR